MGAEATAPWCLSPRMRKTSIDGAQSIKRAARVLRILGAYGRTGASVTKIAIASGLHRATAHRILCALVDEGLLEQNPISRNYKLGAEVFALGAAMGRHFDIKALAQASLDRLSEATQDTVYLAVRTYYDGLCLDMREGAHPDRELRLQVNDTWPLGIGSFTLALLAFLPDGEIEAIIKRNALVLLGQQEITPSILRQHVEVTRRRGFAAISNMGGSRLGSVAVPIFDPHQRPIASLCVTAIVERMDAEREERLVTCLWAESRAITRLWCEASDSQGRNDTWREGLAARPVPAAPPLSH